MRFTLFLFFLISNLCVGQKTSILFTQQENNNDNIYLLSESGELSRITNHPRKDSSPALSPDGKWLVFTSERVGWWKIWTMDMESKKVFQLTHEGAAAYSPSWSPDGTRIVFIHSKDGNQEIYIMDKNGNSQTNITKSKGDEGTPYWANDNKIYFSMEVNGIYQLARINPDGTGKEILTTGNDNKLMPQLSNDFSKILYYGDADGKLDICVMELKSKKITRLTNDVLMDMRPRWSPDNQQIVFERGNKGNNHHIYIMDTNGGNVKQLTFDKYNYAPTFCVLKK